MVTSIVPLFFTFHLGFTQFELGVFNGAYLLFRALAAIIGSALADRYRRYKEVAGVGYGMSAAAKVGPIGARNAWFPATALLYADKTGARDCGRRRATRCCPTPARQGRLGEAFGVHRALDTAGALGGPFLAYLILTAAWLLRRHLHHELLGRDRRPPLSSCCSCATPRRASLPKTRGKRPSIQVVPRTAQATPFRRLVIAGVAFQPGHDHRRAGLHHLPNSASSYSTCYFPLLSASAPRASTCCSRLPDGTPR